MEDTLDKPYKKNIELNIIYRVRAMTYLDTGSFRPYIYIKGGTVDIYGSASFSKPTSLSDMVLSSDDTDINGVQEVLALPTYICVVANQGTPTEIISNSVELEAVGTL